MNTIFWYLDFKAHMNIAKNIIKKAQCIFDFVRPENLRQEFFFENPISLYSKKFVS